jgi:hypothetical protein
VGRARIPSWLAVATGAALGLAFATGGVAAWNAYVRSRRGGGTGVREVAAMVDLFRLPPSRDREMLLVPAGPDANGEPSLARALFPGEEPPRELASLLLANVSPDEAWTVDRVASPLSCRGSETDAWLPLAGVGGESLSPAEALRLRSLGGPPERLVVEPGSMRRVLMALPANSRLPDLSGVQWGDMPLVRDRLELERVRRFREDPAAVRAGR